MSHLILLRGAPGSGKTNVGEMFACRFGWRFVELDAVKRSRGDVMKFDPGAFSEAGRQARVALDAGESVIAEEFFNLELLIALFLEPTGLTIQSPNFVAVRLDCEVEVAVRRKVGLDPRIVRETHAVISQRYALPDEITLDTTSEAVEAVVGSMVRALAARGLRLTEQPATRP
jgi:hypothetical protein